MLKFLHIEVLFTILPSMLMEADLTYLPPQPPGLLRLPESRENEARGVLHQPGLHQVDNFWKHEQHTLRRSFLGIG